MASFEGDMTPQPPLMSMHSLKKLLVKRGYTEEELNKMSAGDLYNLLDSNAVKETEPKADS